MNKFEIQVWAQALQTIEKGNFNLRTLKPLGTCLYIEGTKRIPKETFSHVEVATLNLWWDKLPRLLEASGTIPSGSRFSFILEVTPNKSGHGSISITSKVVLPEIISNGKTTVNINPLVAEKMMRSFGIELKKDVAADDKKNKQAQGFNQDFIEMLSMLIIISNSGVKWVTVGDHFIDFLYTEDKSISAPEFFKKVNSGEILINRDSKYVQNTLKAYNTFGGDENFDKFERIVRSYEMAITSAHLQKMMDSKDSQSITPFAAAFSMVAHSVSTQLGGEGVMYVIKHPWLSFTQDLKVKDRHTAPFSIDVLKLAFKAMEEKGEDGDNAYKGMETLIPLHAIVSSLLNEKEASYVYLDELAIYLNKSAKEVFNEIRKDPLLYSKGDLQGRQVVTLYSIFSDEEDLSHELAHQYNEEKDVSYEEADELFEKTKLWMPEAKRLNSDQVLAVKNSTLKKISIITGGPGTGKTTLLRVLVANALISGINKIAVLAPSSRAANNLFKQLPPSEFRGVHVSTISEYIGSQHSTNYAVFNKDKPASNYSYGMVIVDESSMVNHQILKKVLISSPKADFVLCGDVDQIGSIGRGNPFADIINQEEVTANSVTRLSKNYRQESGSDIPDKAKSILKGNLSSTPVKLGYFTNGYSATSGDFVNIEVDSFENGDALTSAVREVIKAIAKGAITDKDNDPFKLSEVQIISPDKSEERVGELAATETLNGDDDIKNTFNKNRTGESLDVSVNGRDEKFFVSDRVIVNKNAKPEGLINGQMGIVKRIGIGEENKKSGMVVAFEGIGEIEITAKAAVLGRISHAVAISAHKSQGSEYNCVIVVIGKDSMGSKNLLYTAVTRAQKLCILISSSGAAAKMANTNEDRGNSMLSRNINTYHKAKRGINLS